jgi:hypothetical protein
VKYDYEATFGRDDMRCGRSWPSAARSFCTSVAPASMTSLMGGGISLYVKSAVAANNCATLNTAANKEFLDVSKPLGRLGVVIDMPDNGAPDWGEAG